MTTLTHSSICSLLLTCAALACSEPVETSGAAIRLWDQSGSELDALPPVPRLVLEGAPQISAEDVWLAADTLSARSLNLIRKGQVPDVVANKRVPLASWSEQENLIIAPTQILDTEQIYTLFAVGFGLIAQLECASGEELVLRRYGNEFVESGQELVYCPVESLPIENDVLLDETELPDGVSRGLGGEFSGDDACVRVRVDPRVGDVFVPPARVGGAWLSPEPVLVVDEVLVPDEEPIDERQREAEEGGHCFSIGCMRVDRAGLELDFAPGPYAVNIAAEETRLYVVELTKEPFVIGPIAPKSELEITVAHLVAPDQTYRARLDTPGPAARFVITEVLANPQGPEPRSEWVEIANVGTKAGSLGGHRLVDEGGETLLPDVILRAGEYGLIARRDFSFESDFVPHPLAVPVFVDALGRDGLRNSGERVSLLNRDGKLLSVVPGLQVPEGRSLARRNPWSPDVERSFAPHGEAGASPGRLNAFDDAQ